MKQRAEMVWRMKQECGREEGVFAAKNSKTLVCLRKKAESKVKTQWGKTVLGIIE